MSSFVIVGHQKATGFHILWFWNAREDSSTWLTHCQHLESKKSRHTTFDRRFCISKTVCRRSQEIETKAKVDFIPQNNAGMTIAALSSSGIMHPFVVYIAFSREDTFYFDVGDRVSHRRKHVFGLVGSLDSSTEVGRACAFYAERKEKPFRSTWQIPWWLLMHDKLIGSTK